MCKIDIQYLVVVTFFAVKRNIFATRADSVCVSVTRREFTVNPDREPEPSCTIFFPPFFQSALHLFRSVPGPTTTGRSSSSKNKRCDVKDGDGLTGDTTNSDALTLLCNEDKTSACSKARSGNNYNKHQQKKTTTMAETFPRINGGMIQSGQFTGQLVSLVGKLVSHDKIQAADGTVVTLKTDSMNEQPIVNPDMVVEVMGQPEDETTFTVRRYYDSIWFLLVVAAAVVVVVVVLLFRGCL